MTYTHESLYIDVEWLKGYGIDESESIDFIKNLIKEVGGKLKE